ncbi:hypothetical protein J6590_034431 [Homalodisca vitripennis]|nr:hypothetical protein J6590_034431 [Homalodisca vitripennis]
MAKIDVRRRLRKWRKLAPEMTQLKRRPTLYGTYQVCSHSAFYTDETAEARNTFRKIMIGQTCNCPRRTRQQSNCLLVVVNYTILCLISHHCKDRVVVGGLRRGSVLLFTVLALAPHGKCDNLLLPRDRYVNIARHTCTGLNNNGGLASCIWHGINYTRRDVIYHIPQVSHIASQATGLTRCDS